MKPATKFQTTVRSGLLVSLAALALSVTSTPLLAQSSFFNAWQQGQHFLVEFADEKLSVKGDSIPVKELLLQIQEQTGIVVNFVSNPTNTVSLDINEQSVENVIAKISDNHMIIHDNVNGKKTISELIIISAGTSTDTAEVASDDSVSEFLPSGEPAPLIAAATPDSEDKQEKTEKL